MKGKKEKECNGSILFGVRLLFYFIDNKNSYGIIDIGRKDIYI